MLKLPLGVECKDLITNSFKAFLESSGPIGTRTAAILNEEIVRDSESDNDERKPGETRSCKIDKPKKTSITVEYVMECMARMKARFG